MEDKNSNLAWKVSITFITIILFTATGIYCFKEVVFKKNTSTTLYSILQAETLAKSKDKISQTGLTNSENTKEQNTNNQNLKKSHYCTDPPIKSKSGEKIYPIQKKYQHLVFLGQIFTAYKCGEKRLDKIDGVNKNQYILGSSVWLNKTNTELTKILESIGYECKDETTNENCKKWNLEQPIRIKELLKLKPFSDFFITDDCVVCG